MKKLIIIIALALISLSVRSQDSSTQQEMLKTLLLPEYGELLTDSIRFRNLGEYGITYTSPRSVPTIRTIEIEQIVKGEVETIAGEKYVADVKMSSRHNTYNVEGEDNYYAAPFQIIEVIAFRQWDGADFIEIHWKFVPVDTINKVILKTVK